MAPPTPVTAPEILQVSISYSVLESHLAKLPSTGYSVREEIPLPDKPPYTVHLGNLSFDATVGDVTDFFTGCDVVNVRIIEDRLEQKPKGFGYAEFSTREGILKALELSGSQFQGRNIRVSVADPRKSFLLCAHSADADVIYSKGE
jgi:RNA recognition motif-containing protein